MKLILSKTATGIDEFKLNFDAWMKSKIRNLWIQGGEVVEVYL